SPCARTQGRAGAPERSRGGRSEPRPGHSSGEAGRERDRALREGVRAPRDVHAPARHRALALRPARARMGLRIREPLEHRRRLRATPAGQDRRALRLPLARNGSRSRVSAPRRGSRMRTVPIRVRVAGAFAVAVAIVLAGTSWFVSGGLRCHLTTALAPALRLRAEGLRAVARSRLA